MFNTSRTTHADREIAPLRSAITRRVMLLAKGTILSLSDMSVTFYKFSLSF